MTRDEAIEVMRPGDTLIVVPPDWLNPAEVRDAITAKLPDGARVVVVGPDIRLVILRQEGT